MVEKILRFQINERLPKEILEEIINEFDKSHEPINYSGFDKKPSELSHKMDGLRIIVGKVPYSISQIELIRYPNELEYLEVKGFDAMKIIESKLEFHGIKYKTTLEAE